MIKNESNKFKVAHNSLVEFCNNCKSDKKNTCKKYDDACDEYREKFYRTYYEDLYPYHACSQCLMWALSKDKKHCEETCPEYWYHYHVRCIADNEIKGFSVYFGKDRIPFIAGPKDIITKEYVNSAEDLKKNVNMHFTEDIIAEVRQESFYPDVLKTVWQYLEYCDDLKKTKSVTSFKLGFF